MIDLKYSLTIEATEEPDYFGFLFTGLDRFCGHWSFRRRLSVSSEMGLAGARRATEGQWLAGSARKS